MHTIITEDRDKKRIIRALLSDYNVLFSVCESINETCDGFATYQATFTVECTDREYDMLQEIFRLITEFK